MGSYSAHFGPIWLPVGPIKAPMGPKGPKMGPNGPIWAHRALYKIIYKIRINSYRNSPFWSFGRRLGPGGAADAGPGVPGAGVPSGPLERPVASLPVEPLVSHQALNVQK